MNQSVFMQHSPNETMSSVVTEIVQGLYPADEVPLADCPKAGSGYHKTSVTD